jgi:hypothetical protein
VIVFTPNFLAGIIVGAAAVVVVISAKHYQEIQP